MSNSITTDKTTEDVGLLFEGDVAIIQLGAPTERVVTWTEKRLESFEIALDEIQENLQTKAIVIIGPNPKMFCAGADVNLIKDVRDRDHAMLLAKRGQDVFFRLESFPLPKTAAISGPCAGGGFELALACNYRIALDNPSTQIGLPEVKLGIIPGFGGSVRLPRLIGLPRAMSLILKGKLSSAKDAHRLGLVDRVYVPKEGDSEEESFKKFRDEARFLALGKLSYSRREISFKERFLTNTPLGRFLVRKQSEKAVLKETKGNYPAPLRALDVAIKAIAEGEKSGYIAEQEAIGDLAPSKESKSLVHLFISSEECSKLGKMARGELDGLGIGVIGGGVMGIGIAATFLTSNYPVTIIEPVESQRQKAREKITEIVSKKRSLTETEKSRLLGRLRIEGDLNELAQTQIVVEAIVEDIAIKREILQNVFRILGENAYIATNTSSLSVSELAQALPNRSRFFGMHFFNPVEKMPLVEIIRGQETSDHTALIGAALTQSIKKFPVIVEDMPGFLVNRILTPYLVEAAHLLQDGYSIEEIDKAAVKFGMPMGPLRLLDEIGLDVASKVSSIMCKHYGERMNGPKFAEKLVSVGMLGKKSGRGFYVYEGKQERPNKNLKSDLNLSTKDNWLKSQKSDLLDRLVLSLVNEAVRCFDEAIAGIPSKEAGGQIDISSVMGFGFPPFRGGVLFYAEQLGQRVVRDRLQALAKSYGARFEPCVGIVNRVESGASFYE
jgi:3-hydroxyacyl-CoA dehydrogenase/enoyl-CoA hydratase/3-hydroxybutyryl-CoA epimerase